MGIFNIGPWELILVLLLALVIFGPEGMIKFARDAAIFIRKVMRSPFWQELISTSEEIREIPKQLVKEAELEESLREINQLNNPIIDPNDIKLDAGEVKRDSDE